MEDMHEYLRCLDAIAETNHIEDDDLDFKTEKIEEIVLQQVTEGDEKEPVKQVINTGISHPVEMEELLAPEEPNEEEFAEQPQVTQFISNLEVGTIQNQQ